MADNRRHSTGNRSSGRRHHYAPNSNLPTAEKQREYYRKLAEQRAAGRSSDLRQIQSGAANVSGQKNASGKGRPSDTRAASADRRTVGTNNRKKKRRRKKRSTGRKILVSLFVILLVAIIAVLGTGYYYLNLIDFDNGKEGLTVAPLDPNGEDDEDEDIININELSDEEKVSLSNANAGINANLDNSEVWYSDSVTNILLMGIDYGSCKFPYGRSDSMIIVSINNATKKVKLVSLSRAVYSAIPGYNNTRLSHAHGYGGPELAIQAIQNNYKIKIDNYASVTFEGFKNIINALGGVTVELEGAEAAAISYVLGSSGGGTYTLNGEQALAFARQRKIDNDRSRTGRQRRILEALATKATKMSIPDMMAAMDDVLPNVRTDMTRTQLIGMLSKAITYLNYAREETVIPHESSDLVLRGGFEVLIVNWQTEIPYVHELFYGDVSAKVING